MTFSSECPDKKLAKNFPPAAPTGVKFFWYVLIDVCETDFQNTLVRFSSWNIKMTKIRMLLIAPLFAGLLYGCGAKNPNAPAKASGAVSYNAKPVKGGNVTFVFEKEGSYNAPIRSDGTYEAMDLPVGEAIVIVETETANPDKKTPTYGGKRAMEVQRPPAGAGPRAEDYVKIPAKFGDAKSSGLKATLKSGDNKHDVEMKD